jgi:3'-5' exonuclease
MLTHIHPENLFIFDIETVPAEKSYGDLDTTFQKLFDDKIGKYRKEDEDKNDYYFNKAGIFAEFGKIICISCGYIQKVKNTSAPDSYCLKIKNFKGNNEKKLLEEFTQVLINVSKNDYYMCGHNIKEFDVPWLCRRFLINNLHLPFILDIHGKKPWEVNFIDTLELWKFGDFKHYTSLHLLATLFNIPTPKDDIDGSMVGRVYYHENDLDRISTYCNKDVVTVAQLIMRFKGLDLIPDHLILLPD